MEELVRAARPDEVDELAPETPSALGTIATLAIVWSAPFVALALAAWVCRLAA